MKEQYYTENATPEACLNLLFSSSLASSPSIRPSFMGLQSSIHRGQQLSSVKSKTCQYIYKPNICISPELTTQRCIYRLLDNLLV